MRDWINDGEWYCGECDITFKVDVDGDEPDINFCPSCASRKIESIEE